MGYVDTISCWKSGKRAGPFGASDAGPGDYAEVHYDLDRIRKDVDRDALAQGPTSMWRYAALLPVDHPDNVVTLGEGMTPLLPAKRLGEELGLKSLYFKDEGQNPSGTFKDRGASASISRMRELGVTEVIHNSSGNAAGSWAMYAARAGIRCINVVPDDVLPASLQQSAMCGAKTYVLSGPWHTAGPMVAEAIADGRICDVRTLKEPYRVEGKKTMGFEIAEQLGWTVPDVIVYPTGGGLGAIAIYKAFEELMALGWVPNGRLPKLIVSQYTGCAPIAEAFKNGADHAELWTEIDVPPGGLKSTRPPGDQRVLKILRDTGGAAYTVATSTALDAARHVASQEGIFSCPESATTFDALRQAIAGGVVRKSDRVVVLSTGSGLKSIPILPEPEVEVVQPGARLT